MIGFRQFMEEYPEVIPSGITRRWSRHDGISVGDERYHHFRVKHSTGEYHVKVRVPHEGAKDASVSVQPHGVHRYDDFPKYANKIGVGGVKHAMKKIRGHLPGSINMLWGTRVSGARANSDKNDAEVRFRSG